MDYNPELKRIAIALEHIEEILTHIYLDIIKPEEETEYPED